MVIWPADWRLFNHFGHFWHVMSQMSMNRLSVICLLTVTFPFTQEHVIDADKQFKIKFVQ